MSAFAGSGSGAVPVTSMIRSGATFDIAGAISIIALLPLMVAAPGVGCMSRRQPCRD
ncbi:hypothetical protein [Arthrobacter sp. SLBN-53]|uniref:hypothetical protein n=1 Tax=Arthrobacter sp. SLBN-53 TaxID=2768412 RepID=UPI00135A4C9F|nr:hypothetical protein [Arthrobacter sp. SLBN-53]